MKAYMIVRCVIHDREKFISGYGAEAAKLLEKYGGMKFLFLAIQNWLSCKENTREGFQKTFYLVL